MENILHIPLLPEEPLENKINKMVDALCRHKDKVLMEVVFHTAFTLTLSLSPIAQLFRNICFKPHVVKVSQDVRIQILPFMITLSGVGSFFTQPALSACRQIWFGSVSSFLGCCKLHMEPSSSSAPYRTVHWDQTETVHHYLYWKWGGQPVGDAHLSLVSLREPGDLPNISCLSSLYDSNPSPSFYILTKNMPALR